LFKGIKYKIYDVNNIVRSDNGFIDSVITTTSSEYNEYKISVILSDVYYNDNSGTPYNINALVNYNDIVNIYNNGIHIIINKIYKNILVIINYAFALTGSTSDTINNVDLYGEKFGLYYSKNKNSSESRIGTYDPTILTTSNFINCLNNLNDKNGFDNYITYYYIEKNENNQTVTGSTIINGINNPSLPKILLRGEKPIPIKINRNSFGVETIKGPDYKNLYKNMTIGSSKILNEPLGRRLFKNYSLPIYETIYRFNGPYEPIFKDIELYKSASFCYTGYETGATYSTGVTYTANPKNSRDFSELKESIDWINTERLCSTDKYTYFVVYIAPGSMAHSVITNYLIMDNFNFGIPTNSEIEGIEVIIDRRSPAGYGDPPTDFYTKDYSVELKYKTELSNNKAKVNKWPTVYTEETYGGPTDTWGMTLNSVKLNNSDFGLKLSVEAFNSTSKPKYLSEVKCVTINVYTSVSGMTETYSNVTFFDENIKFDTSLRNFGEVSEFIYSKVNPYNESILRFKDNIYPIVDQFGYSYDDRFIFKSTWDYDFYYKTTDKFEDDNVKYDRPPINTTLLNMTLPNNPLSLD
ncbi:MAG: hypothetical protein KDH96_10605, partial [Candidatus Riesia sp.]|nr:hypothetical protein [Candidatus Riesia sp.]